MLSVLGAAPVTSWALWTDGHWVVRTGTDERPGPEFLAQVYRAGPTEWRAWVHLPGVAGERFRSRTAALAWADRKLGRNRRNRRRPATGRGKPGEPSDPS